MDAFQSKPAVKLVKAAKTVQVVKAGAHSEGVVSGAEISATALHFIRAWKKQRLAQQ